MTLYDLHPLESGRSLGSRISLDSIHYFPDGIDIDIEDFYFTGREKYKISFGAGVLSVRICNESYLLDVPWSWTSSEPSGIVPSVGFSEESALIDEFHKASMGVRSEQKVFHVAVLTQQEWIDVLCLSLPIISPINW